MIYLDNHSTTRCDPRVIEAMLPWLGEKFGNPHSGHAFGRQAAEAIQQSTEQLAGMLGTNAENVVITSGATESNNLAIRGVCLHPRQKRRHIVTVSTEHPSVLDVVDDLRRDGFRVTVVPVIGVGRPDAGIVDLDQLAETIDDDTAIVSVMAANNEIGAIAPLRAIAEMTHTRGAVFHCDASQSVGRLPMDVKAMDVDLLSVSGHKFYGPKGIGILVVGNGNRRVRLRPQIVGGGQQHGFRSGTMNPAGVIALETALSIGTRSMQDESQTVQTLRDRFWRLLSDGIEGLELNGPPLDSVDRLSGNLNVMLPAIEGESWMASASDVAFSTGSACSNVDPTPSHVLMALGLSESCARRSVRFGIGRFNTEKEIDSAAEQLIRAWEKLVRLGNSSR